MNEITKMVLDRHTFTREMDPDSRRALARVHAALATLQTVRADVDEDDRPTRVGTESLDQATAELDAAAMGFVDAQLENVPRTELGDDEVFVAVTTPGADEAPTLVCMAKSVRAAILAIVMRTEGAKLESVDIRPFNTCAIHRTNGSINPFSATGIGTRTIAHLHLGSVGYTIATARVLS